MQADEVMGLVEAYLRAASHTFNGNAKEIAYGALESAIRDLCATNERLEGELAQGKQFYKELVMDFCPDIECPPDAKCDSWGHDDECPVVNAQASIRKVRDERDSLKSELAESEAANDALNLKLESLGFHASQTCGCSYDRKEDVCLHHSPQLTAATQENERLKAKLAGARELMKSVVIHARRYHECNDGPFDLADKFVAGKSWEEDPIL